MQKNLEPYILGELKETMRHLMSEERTIHGKQERHRSRAQAGKTPIIAARRR
jgi:hypothetical protein